jgi:hypothetical protein
MMIRSTLRFLLLVVVTLTLSRYSVKAQNDNVDIMEFFYACSGGRVDDVKAFLQEHPGACVTQYRFPAYIYCLSTHIVSRLFIYIYI